MTETLRGRQIVIAGGTGRLGSTLASDLLAEGARLILSYHRNRERASRWEGSATVLQVDLAYPSQRAALLDAAPDLYGLVAFAGNPARVGDASQIQDAMSLSHEVNYLGPILLAREAADRMKASSTQGAIVLISTMQANTLMNGSTVYAAQKAALQHAARILARECRGPANIRVNT